MKIELKRITYNARLSQETAAFAADVYIDGKKAGEVANDGHGGCNSYRPWALGGQIEAYAKTLPRRPFGHGMEGDFQPDADTLVGDILDEYLMQRDLKRALGRKVLFLRGGKLYEMKKGGPAPRDAEKVLNNLPLDEALKVYRAAVGGAS